LRLLSLKEIDTAKRLWSYNKKLDIMKYFLRTIFSLVVLGSPVFADCVDLTQSGSFSLKRNAPYLAVTNSVSDDGTVTEVSDTTQNGSAQRVTTTYWNGVIAVDRRSNSSHIQMIIDDDAKLADLSEPGQVYSYPISILVNGNELDRGSFTINTMEETTLLLGGCRYEVMVVRTTLERNGGTPINEEALLNLEAGMLLGNVAMTSDWQARTGVFFDEIEAH
jgi:hypothetical protein